MTPSDKSGSASRDPIAIWDDILDLVAEDDAEAGEPSADDIQWSQSVDAKMKSRLAELRRQLTPSDVTIKRGVTIPSEILALCRNDLIARIEILRQAPNVQYAHQDLTGLSDNDLRTMLVVLVGRTKE
jgi:hypothetical protein